jgi:hypothetical protein
VPIYVADNVLESAGVTLQNPSEQEEAIRPSESSVEQDDNLEVYRDFINSLDVLDEFGKSD